MTFVSLLKPIKGEIEGELLVSFELTLSVVIAWEYR